MSSKQKTPPSIYTLHPMSPANEQSPNPRSAPMMVLIAKPELPNGYDTDRIALLFEQDRRLDYYANAKWSGRLDELLQDFMMQMVHRTAPDRFAGTTTPTANTHHKLGVKIADFQPVYQAKADSPPRLDVDMTVTLMSLPGDKVKAQISVKKSAPASANTMTVVTKELESLLQSATQEALQKILPSFDESHRDGKEQRQ